MANKIKIEGVMALRVPRIRVTLALRNGRVVVVPPSLAERIGDRRKELAIRKLVGAKGANRG